MGTINYFTSDYITLGVKPYNVDNFKSDPDFIEETTELYGEVNDGLIYDYINNCYDDDRRNVEHALNERNFYYFHITIEPGYYEGFSLNIENNSPVCFDGWEDKRNAQKEITEIRQFLLECAGLGLVKCSPGWCTAYYNFQETVKAINTAIQDIRDEVRRTPTWNRYRRGA